MRHQKPLFIFCLLSLFWKNKIRLMRSPCCLSVHVSVNPPPTSNRLLNDWTNHYEIWYIYHGTYAHQSGILHKCLPSVCGSVCVSLLSLIGNGSVNTFPRQRGIIWNVVFCAVRVVSNECKLSVLSRTSCLRIRKLGWNILRTNI
jgi:hypothetical protein